MPVTGLRGRQILDGDVVRADLNITTEGSAVIRRIIAGTNISITSTGVDSGTGDVTISATGTGLNGTGFVRMSGTTVSYISGTSLQYVLADGTLKTTTVSTDFVQYGDYITGNTFSNKTVSLNPGIIKGLLWGGAGTRYTDTNTYTGTYPNAGSTWIKTIELIDGSNAVYPSGNIYMGFWVNRPPASISVRVQNTSGTWFGPFTGSEIRAGGSCPTCFAFWKIPVGGGNYIKKWEITLVPQDGFSINLQTLDIVIDNSEGIDQAPLVGRGGSSIYGNLSFVGSGNATNVTITNAGVGTFAGALTASSFVRSGGTASQFLKANGSVDSTTYHSGNSIWSQVFSVYAVGANTAITNTDTLETALEKLQGQVDARLTGNQTITVSGDASGSGATAIALTLATVNSNVGTFNNVTVNAKGLVTAASNVSYLTGNQAISLTGEATGSGATSIAVTLTNSAVIGKVLTGLNITGGTVAAADSILTAFGKLQNQVNGLTGGVTYQGTWNASTNTPTLASSAGTKGFYYVVSVAGSTALNGVSTWSLGDWVIYNGTAWEKVDNTDAVISVNGFTGAVSLTTANVSESGNLYYTDARARAAITLTTTGSSGAATYSGGTLNIPTYTLAGLGGQTALNGTGFVKISGTTITYDNSTYALSSHTHSYFIGTTAVQTSSANQGLTGISSIGFVAEGSDSASISTTISGTSTFFDFNLTDDNNNDEWRWRFTPSGATVYNAMRLVPVSNTAANLIVSGTITGSQIIRSGGTASQFLKADGSVDSSSYVPTSRTLTINGTTFDLSADRSWTITATGGVSSLSAGSGISVSSATGAITVTNTGLLSATAGSGISVSTTSGVLNIVNTGILSSTAGSGISVSTASGVLNIVNTGLLSATSGSGISVSTASGTLNIVNTGLLSATAGTGISVSTTSGTLNIVNTITNTNQLTNGAGYITGITSGMVTTALGYTPYNSTNPNGYITASSSNTLTNKSGNISQWTNDSGYITATSSTYTYSASLTLSTSWQNTGVTATELSTSGVYIVTCAVNDFGVGGGQYTETYVGMMYWYAAGTNSNNAAEISLHHSGHADNDRYIYLRTWTDTGGATGKIYLQIKGNGNNSAASTYSFTFKRLL